MKDLKDTKGMEEFSLEKMLSGEKVFTRGGEEVLDFHSINKSKIGENIYIGRLIEAINNVPNVININSIKCFNKVGDNYSNNEMQTTFLDNTTREIDLTDGTLYNSYDGVFEIKYNTDVKVTISKLG
jgi:hypothetical protein